MKFVKAAIVLVGCTMYPSAFFANAAGADGGTAGDHVIQEEGQQVLASGTSAIVSIKLNRVNKQSQTAI